MLVKNDNIKHDELGAEQDCVIIYINDSHNTPTPIEFLRWKREIQFKDI